MHMGLVHGVVGTRVEAFGNTLHCRVEIKSDEVTCIQCFKFLLVRSLCVGATPTPFH